MNKTTLCLVRHGQTDWNKNQLIQGLSDIPLNETGIAQAHAAGKALAKNLSTQSWDVIVSSPLTRAHHTAQIIADYLDYQQDIVLIDDLKERDFGVANGQHVDLYYAKVMEDDVDQMERNEALIARVCRGLDEITKNYPQKNVLVICHSHIIKAAIIHASEGNYDFTLKLDNTSLNMIEHQDATYKLIAHNISDHVELVK